MGVKEIEQEDVDSTDLVRDKDKWRAVVNAVMNVQFA
jgi:hypothetical protein